MVAPPTATVRLLVLGLTAVAIGHAGLVVTRLPPSEPLLTTYGAASSTAHGVGLLGGVSLLLVGAWTAARSPTRRAGVLLTAAGALWFAPDWTGWEGGPPLLRALATAATPFLPVVLLHLTSTLLGSTPLRRATAVAATAVAVLSLSTALVVDPFLDPHCWRNCSDNPLLLWSLPQAAPTLATATAGVWTLTCATAAAVAARRLTGSTATVRRWHGPALTAAAVTGTVETAYGIALLRLVESPRSEVFLTLYAARAAAWVLLALAVAARAARLQRRRAALARLARDLEGARHEGGVESALRAVSGDDELEVQYSVGPAGRWVTPAGRPAPPPVPAPERRTTVLYRGSTAVARLRHDPDLLPAGALQGVLGPAARLALENERLTAEQLARLHDVRASRARIVAAGDAARRRLERDLHDGAQQRLLALGHLVRLARTTARDDVAEQLDAAVAEAQRALEDLRALADGIHPAVLGSSGLAAALQSLADRAEVPVELPALVSDRLPPSVELAAYAVVRDAVRGATAPLEVRATRATDALVVEVSGGVDRLPEEVADRVGALGGHTASSSDGWRAVLPCG